MQHERRGGAMSATKLPTAISSVALVSDLTVVRAVGMRRRMRRIVVLGNAGSGKSTFARRLGERLALPVVHLDLLFWEPRWKETDNEVFRSRLSIAIAGDAWVCEGNYARRSFDLRLAKADLVIWLDTPRLQCLGRVVLRTLLGRPRPDLPAGCQEGLLTVGMLEFFTFCWTFDLTRRAAIDAERQAQGPDVPVVHLRGKRQIEAFLREAS